MKAVMVICRPKGKAKPGALAQGKDTGKLAGARKKSVTDGTMGALYLLLFPLPAMMEIPVPGSEGQNGLQCKGIVPKTKITQDVFYRK